MADPPRAVRILPMDSHDEFAESSVEDVQREFFLRDLPGEPRRGRYLFHTRGLNAKRGTVVLFQYANLIIASATFDRSELFDEPEGSFRGALYFDANSIRTFDPVEPDRVRAIWPKVKRFNQTKWQLSPAGYLVFERGLTNIKMPRTTRPREPRAEDFAAPPLRVPTTVSRIVRDTVLSSHVKELHNFECQICGETISLPDGSRYAESHHIRPLGKPHNGPDVLGNIICLCPNHHAACDLGAIPLGLIKLRSVAGHRVSKRYVDYHNRTIYCG